MKCGLAAFAVVPISSRTRSYMDIDWAAATAEMAVIEYLTNVGAIADQDAFFLFAPVKIAGTRGGYGRAIALVGD